MGILSGERRMGDVKLKMKGSMLVVETSYNYYVQTNSNESRVDVLNTPGVPIPNQTFDPEGLGVCTSVSITRQDNTSRIWELQAEFSSDVEDKSGQNYNQTNWNPETWVPEREMFLEPYEEVRIKDLNDKPYANGAGTPFDQGPTVQKDNIRYDFWQLESATVDDGDIVQRNNTLNDAEFLGQPKHTLLLKVRRSVIGIYYGVRRRIVEYSLTYNEDNWHQKLANMGDTFVHNGNVYPYRYKSDPNTVVTGPLGRKDYLFDEDYDDSAAKPTGTGDPDADRVEAGTDDEGDTFYAIKTTTPELFFVERQVYRDDVDWTTFLRFPDQ